MNRADIKAALLGTGLVSQGQIRGCSQVEVDGLVRSLGQSLPMAYSEYLFCMGHGAGSFLAGTDTSFGHLHRLKNSATSLLQENSRNPLSVNAFVFYMHQGYEFGYFLLGNGEDPPVYQYVEGGGEPEIAWSSFSAYLTNMLQIFSSGKPL